MWFSDKIKENKLALNISNMNEVFYIFWIFVIYIRKNKIQHMALVMRIKMVDPSGQRLNICSPTSQTFKPPGVIPQWFPYLLNVGKSYCTCWNHGTMSSQTTTSNHSLMEMISKLCCMSGWLGSIRDLWDESTFSWSIWIHKPFFVV